MKEIGRKILKYILMVVVIVGALYLGVLELQNFTSRREYDKAMQIAVESGDSSDGESEEENGLARDETAVNTQPVVPDDPHIRWLLTVDLESLQETNEDVIGWVYIPDTKISYPLLQGEDNDYYLNHSWKKTKSSAGSIFLEHQNDPNFCDFNTIIYGHNMTNKTMFGGLRDYKSSEYLEEHSSFYILNQSGIFRYDVFAVNKAGVDTVTYGMKIETEKKREEFIRFSLDYSDVETGLVPTTEDKIVTLSTCSGTGYSTRWVVQGVLNKEGSYIVNDPYLM